MSGFDDHGVFFSDNLDNNDTSVDTGNANRQQIKNRFKDFIRQFHEENFNYRYRFVFLILLF